jgi:Ni,Fe-hydrogenase III component G
LEKLLKVLKDKFGQNITGHEIPLPTRLFVDIKANSVREIAREVVAQGGRYLVGIGYDNIARDGNIGMIHAFGFDRDNFIVHLRAAVPASNPVMPSITPDIPGAGWSEREYQDLLGLKFEGHPKPKRLVVADDWPLTYIPLGRKSHII